MNDVRPCRPQQPPLERGRRLAAFRRGRHGEEELRVTLDEYEGHPYVAIRLWVEGDDGVWYPSRKGTSVRLAEAGELSDVLAAVAKEYGGARGPDRRQDPRPGSRGSSRWGGGSPRQQQALPPPRASAVGGDHQQDRSPPFEPGRFSEFADE
jgi:hypothetical protein